MDLDLDRLWDRKLDVIFEFLILNLKSTPGECD